MSNKEVDLFEFLKRILIFIRNNFWFLLIMFIVGGGLGYGIHEIRKPVYSSKAVFSTWIDRSMLEQILNDFEYHIEKDFELALRKKDIRKVNDNKLKEITFELTDHEVIHKTDKEFIYQYVLIHALAKDEHTLEILEDVMKDYFENNTYLARHRNSQRESLKNLRNEIEYELEKHKKEREKNLLNQNDQKFILYANHRMEDAINLVKLRNEVNNKLSKLDIITFIQPFSTPREESVIPASIVVLGFALLLTFIGAIVRKVVKEI